MILFFFNFFLIVGQRKDFGTLIGGQPMRVNLICDMLELEIETLCCVANQIISIEFEAILCVSEIEKRKLCLFCEK